eukprot:SAG31_NODE_619_length_13509_cov_3.297539_1_plen_113_part_00
MAALDGRTTSHVPAPGVLTGEGESELPERAKTRLSAQPNAVGSCSIMQARTFSLSSGKAVKRRFTSLDLPARAPHHSDTAAAGSKHTRRPAFVKGIVFLKKHNNNKKIADGY